MLKLRLAGALAGLCLAAACSSSPAAIPAAFPGGSDHPAAVTRVVPAAATEARATAVMRTPVPKVTISRVRTRDGSVVTVATFRGPVQYILHNGSEDPGPAAGRVHAGPVVGGAERKRLLAAFNGGFKLSAGAGGYQQEGHVISPLRRGLASLVIDRSGQARIGIWGHGVPAPGEAVYSVRQNLQALVANGHLIPAATDWPLWGATLGGGEYVARSAIGQDASGDLIYAASISTTPADLADVLAGSGARIAMELDINPEWVQLDAARAPGGPLSAEVPGQNRPADQYLVGWTRDFFTVVAPSAGRSAAPLASRQFRP